MFDKDMLNQLYRYAYTLTGDESEAYDLLQDSVERCLKRADQQFNSLEFYAKRVMRNHYIDQLRHKQRFPEKEFDEMDEQPVDLDTNGLEKLIINEQQLDCVWQQLNHVEREILFYWSVEDMTAQEIADVMDMRLGTVLSRIHRLRQRLKSSFDESDAVGQKV